jgi:hypothetical protein
MRKFSLILASLAATLPQLLAESENVAILAAAESYMSGSATVKVKYIVEQVEGDLARVRINPESRPNRDTAWIFVKKTDGKWTAISARAWFSPEEYERLGIPKSLQIPH